MKIYYSQKLKRYVVSELNKILHTTDTLDEALCLAGVPVLEEEESLDRLFDDIGDSDD